MTCKFMTILDRECGRPAAHQLAWQEHPVSATGPYGEWVDMQQPVCEVHRDIMLADLLLDCLVGEVKVLTLDTGTPVPFNLMAGSPTLTRIALALTEGAN